MAHDAEDAVGDAVALDRVAGSGLGVDGAVGPAQPTAAKDLARMFGRDGLVRFARRVVEVENEPKHGDSCVQVAGLLAIC